MSQFLDLLNDIHCIVVLPNSLGLAKGGNSSLLCKDLCRLIIDL